MDKIINLLINNWTKGVDTYTHNGSTWLIFTEQKSWVIELTESKTLWYNYNFFKELFSLTSMDVVDNQHYITKWVEDNIINKVKDTILEKNITEGEVEEIIENGFKGIKNRGKFTFIHLDDIIQNGVKETNHVDVMKFFDNKMDDALENGIKETHDDAHNHKDRIDGVIKGGVKHTEIGWHQCNNIDDAIENGVKVTLFNQGHKRLTVKNIIENGVRHTLNTEYMPTSMVEDIIENGVKKTKTPGKDGDIMSTIEWMEENKSTSYTKMINDIIENGTKNPSV
jgi:hypothetical protein